MNYLHITHAGKGWALALFNSKAKCANCHTSTADPANGKVLFTDFTYLNIGVPKNSKKPFYSELTFNPLGASWVDMGLGGYLKSAGFVASVYEPELGKFKVPTLRNVDKRPNTSFVKSYNRQLCTLISAGKAKPSLIISHELPLDEAPEAYKHFDARDNGWTKVILHPNSA